MVLTKQDFIIKVGLLVAAVAVANLHWSTTLNPDAPALFYLGSLLPGVIAIPIVAVVPGALFYAFIAMTVNQRTSDHLRACFLMGMYVVALWWIYSRVIQILDTPRPSTVKGAGGWFWYYAYVCAFFYSLPGVSVQRTQDQIAQDKTRRQQIAQQPGMNRWLLLCASSLFVFTVTFVTFWAVADPDFALRLGGMLGGVSAVVLGTFLLVGDAVQGRLRFWNITYKTLVSEESRRTETIDWDAKKQQLIAEKNWRGLVQLSRDWAEVETVNFSAWFSLGLAHLHLVEYQEAKHAFVRACLINRDDAGAWYNLGLAYEQLWKNESAITAYQNALRCKPGMNRAAKRLRVLQEQSQNENARANDTSDRRNEKTHSGTRDADAKWYVVLGVRDDATFKEVRAAYRKLMQDYHPDRVANLGKDLRDLAELKTKTITEAFRAFESSRQK